LVKSKNNLIATTMHHPNQNLKLNLWNGFLQDYAALFFKYILFWPIKPQWRVPYRR